MDGEILRKSNIYEPNKTHLISAMSLLTVINILLAIEWVVSVWHNTLCANEVITRYCCCCWLQCAGWHCCSEDIARGVELATLQNQRQVQES